PHSRHLPPPHLHPLSLHDALPTSRPGHAQMVEALPAGDVRGRPVPPQQGEAAVTARCIDPGSAHAIEGRCAPDQSDLATSTFDRDRKSTRLNSSHEWSSYAVFCFK